jgi:hypothetical protein
MSLVSPGFAVEGGTATFTCSKTKITEERVKGTTEGLALAVKFALGD